jgi:hypothetical protein
MQTTDTPLFETPCFGALISHVQIFPTHITFQRRFGDDISVPIDMIASVEERVYRNEFVILRTTARRAIICMVRIEGAGSVRPKRATALCAAIRNLHTTSFPAKEIKA